MTNIITGSDFLSGTAMRLSTLGAITPEVTSVGGGYRLSDFAGKRPRFWEGNSPYGSSTPDYIGFNMDGVMELKEGTQTSSPPGHIQSDNLMINKGTVKATVTFDENSHGIIFETGANGVGCALYINNKRLYWQCGKGNVAGGGGTLELSIDITGYSNQAREILVQADLSANQKQGQMYIDFTVSDIVASTPVTGTQYNFAGTDIGGTGKKYNNIAVLRSGEQRDFNGTIHKVKVYDII